MLRGPQRDLTGQCLRTHRSRVGDTSQQHLQRHCARCLRNLNLHHRNSGMKKAVLLACLPNYPEQTSQLLPPKGEESTGEVGHPAPGDGGRPERSPTAAGDNRRPSQRLQYPLTKEYVLDFSRIPNMVSGISLN